VAFIPRTPTVTENASTTSITGTLPGDVVSGDFVLVVFAMACTPAQFTGPGGSWVQLVAPTDNGAAETIAAYYQFSPGAGATGTSAAAAGRATAIVQAWGGVESSNPVDVAAQVTTGTTASLVATGVTTVTAGALLLSGCITDTASRAFVVPPTMTLVASYSAGSVGRALALAGEDIPTPGATGTRTWAMNPSAALAMGAFVVALRPITTAGRHHEFTDAAARRRERMATRPRGRVLLARPSVTGPPSTDVTIAETLGLNVAATRGVTGDVAVTSGVALNVDAFVSVIAASTPITCRLEVLLNSVWVNITSWVTYRSGPVTIRHGRPTEYDDIGPSVLNVELWNDNGEWMPGNTTSQFYPYFGKDTKIKWTVEKAGAEYTRFTGWIQAVLPEYPSNSTNNAVVGIVATDGLGLMAQRKLRSNYTEVALWRGRADATWCDAWEARAETTGMIAFLTNFSTDASPGQPTAYYTATLPILSFSSDNDVEIGAVASCSSTSSCKTVTAFQANALQVKLHVKCPSTQVPTGGPFYLSSFHTTTSGGASLCHLATAQNGADNGLWLRNAAGTANIALLGNLPLGQWCEIVAYSRAVNPARSDWSIITTDGNSGLASDVAIDIRTIRSVEFPSATGAYLSCSWGGVTALGTRTAIDWQEAFPGAVHGTLASRITMLDNVLNQLPITIATTGTLTGNVVTGTWSGRPSSEVLQEMARTYSGIAWARPWDGTIYVIGADQLFPGTAIATIDTDGDCIGSPRLVDGTEGRPTRVDVEWSGGLATAVDTTAEAAGIIRSRRISTVSGDKSTATEAGASVLVRSQGGLRISQVEIDLMGGDQDLSPTLLAETGTLGALYPTVRLRLRTPTSHFGYPTKDVHVQGWTESYGPDQASLRMDTSPAGQAFYAAETWTGTNGSAWSGQWVAQFGTGAATATFDVQSNRGRIVGGAGGTRSGLRLATNVRDVEIFGLFQVTGTAEAQVWWRGQTTGFADAYALIISASGGVRVQQNIGGSITTRYSGFGPTITNGVDYSFRIRHLTDSLAIRVWASSGNEPAWQINTIDSLFMGAGYVGLAEWVSGQSCVFDNFYLTTGE
jgi:hypothetical protein